MIWIILGGIVFYVLMMMLFIAKKTKVDMSRDDIDELAVMSLIWPVFFPHYLLTQYVRYIRVKKELRNMSHNAKKDLLEKATKIAIMDRVKQGKNVYTG